MKTLRFGCIGCGGMGRLHVLNAKHVPGPHGYMGHYGELVALCEAIRHNTEPPMTVEEGRHVLQVEKAILESVSTNQVIDYPQFLSRWGTSQPAR